MEKSGNKEKKAKTKTSLLDLPTDTVRQIMSQLDQNDRASLALVSKSFRSTYYTLIHCLRFKYIPSESQFQKTFLRFTSVNRIVFRFADRIFPALIALSESQLNIEELDLSNFYLPKPKHIAQLAGRLEMVKVLKLDWFVDMTDLQVVELIRLFPSLEELDLSDCLVWTDVGIEKMASDVPNLRRINLNFNRYLTDKSLDALANCVNLEYVSFELCERITMQGFCAYICKRKNNLKSLEVPEYFFSGKEALAESISCCENLSHLSIKGYFIRDDFLCAVANSGSPLTSLELKPTQGGYLSTVNYTMKGLSAMLRAFRGLTRLCVCLPVPCHDTQDTEMSELVKSLPRVKHVSVVSSSATYATLFSLIHSCPLLERICMRFDPFCDCNCNLVPERTGMHYRIRPILFSRRRPDSSLEIASKSFCDWHAHCDASELITKNYSIQHIQILPEPDSSLKTAIKSMCPSLKSWN